MANVAINLGVMPPLVNDFRGKSGPIFHIHVGKVKSDCVSSHEIIDTVFNVLNVPNTVDALEVSL